MWQYNQLNGNSNELYHWGIKGMKWGVRRYQNPDGTLTAAGKQRYSDGDASGTSETTKTAKTTKNPKKMSTEQLQDEVRKKQLRNQLKQLDRDERRSEKVSKEQDKIAVANAKNQLRDVTDSRQQQLKKVETESRIKNAQIQIERAGQSMVGRALRNAGEQALTTAARGAMLYAGSKAVENILKNPDLAKAVATGAYGGSSNKKKDD